MKNLLTLHEAVAVILLSKQNRTATFESIAEDIERRNLFPDRKGGFTHSAQVKIQTSIKSCNYKHWFEFTPTNIIRRK